VEFAARRRELEARLDALVAEGRHFSAIQTTLGWSRG